MPAQQAPFHWIDPRTDHPEHPAITAWTGHIPAGRIGTPPPDPALAAIHAANEALLARRRRERRA